MPALAIRVEAATKALRCAVCHDDLEGGEVRRCAGCRTALHAECARTLRRCPTRGCSGRRPPTRTTPAPAQRGGGLLALAPWRLPLLVGALTPVVLYQAAGKVIDAVLLLSLLKLNAASLAVPGSLLLAPALAFFVEDTRGPRRARRPGLAALVALAATAAVSLGLAALVR
ncbi:MAG: PHD finger domain-containing protein [Planctomycetes bacterium]|nr:PHD finger domain-containing protein [Planctomycetota bacterium]